jgi:hypothetical protein
MKRTTSSLMRAHSRSSFNRLLFESEHATGGGPKDRSLLFRLCQLVVVIFRSVTPLSYVYLAVLFVYGITPNKMGLGTAFYFFLTAWMVIEALFFPYYLYLFTKLQNLNHVSLRAVCQCSMPV